MRRISVVKLLTCLMSVMLLSAAASAQVTWKQVQDKARSAKSYSVLYNYSGPRGEYSFTYAFTPDAIRTDITRASDRSRVGTVVVFDKSWNPERVRAKVGGGVIVRSTSHVDVRDTPFYRSVYEMVFQQTDRLGSPSTRVSGRNTIFTFKGAGGDYRVWVNNVGEILKTERKDDGNVETRRFAGHRWNNSPATSF